MGKRGHPAFGGGAGGNYEGNKVATKPSRREKDETRENNKKYFKKVVRSAFKNRNMKGNELQNLGKYLPLYKRKRI